MIEHQKSPPDWALRFLQWFCPEYLYEEIEGDLIQTFERDVKSVGKRKARRRFVWNAIRFFRPAIIFRRKVSIGLNSLDMLINHIKLASRIFLKDKFFSILNILGLALGISVGILLLLVLQNDLNYDKHNLNYERIYRVGTHQQQTGFDLRWAQSSMALGSVLKEEMPEIEQVIRIDNSWGRRLVKTDGTDGVRAFYEERIADTDSNYFELFTHGFISGNPETCLKDPHAAVLTQSIASKYFAETDPLGKTLDISGELWTVRAVIEDQPDNSHFKFDILLSNRQWIFDQKIVSESFWNPGIYLYILVPIEYDPSIFYSKFPHLFDKYLKSFAAEVDGKLEPILEPLADIHFHSRLDHDEAQGNLMYLYAFIGIGLLIILLACINYMNLSTAKSVSRATEIAIKKLSGSRKSSLITSFLVESIFLAMISLAVAILLVYTILDLTSFNQLIGKNLNLDLINNPLLIFGCLAITLCIGIISGLYPAIFLPSVPLLKALKGAFKNQKSSLLFRKVLITSQFAISIFVVVCTLLMRDQIHFMRNKDLGFDKQNIIAIPILDTTVVKYISGFKNDLLLNPHIKMVSTASSMLGADIDNVKNFVGETETGMKQMGFATLWVTDDYIRTMDLEIITGTDFKISPNTPGETSYLINETGARRMGWGNDAVGKRMKFFHGEIPGHIVGVVKDFNFKSLHTAVAPMLIVKDMEANGYIHIKVDSESLSETISYIKDKWSRVDVNHPFGYSFFDQRFDEQYKADESQNKLLFLLSGICIFISMLGLIGLSAFTAVQRTKECGVRKVLGANVPDIIILLSKDILLLVILSAVLVVPISYWVITRWMEKFAYQTQMNYPLYFIVTIAALGFVFLTVLFQSLKTAISNPVDSLKYE